MHVDNGNDNQAPALIQSMMHAQAVETDGEEIMNLTHESQEYVVIHISRQCSTLVQHAIADMGEIIQITPGHLKNTAGVALQLKRGPRQERATHEQGKVEPDRQSTADTWRMNESAQPVQTGHEAVVILPRQRKRQTRSRNNRHKLLIFQRTMPQKSLQYVLLQYLNLGIDQDETHA